MLTWDRPAQGLTAAVMIVDVLGVISLLAIAHWILA